MADMAGKAVPDAVFEQVERVLDVAGQVGADELRPDRRGVTRAVDDGPIWMN
jgi:hypothetical protein